MNKIGFRITAGVLTGAILLGMTPYKAEATPLNLSKVQRAMAGQEIVVDPSALDEVKGVVCNCTTDNLLDNPVDGAVVQTLYVGQQVVLKAVVRVQDGSEWYRVSCAVSDVIYEGYLPTNHVICYDASRLDTVPRETMKDADAEEPIVPEETAAVQAQADTGEADTEEADTEEVETSIPAAIPANLTADAFETSIASFPESYKPYLRTLHAAHPNWVFVPQITNIDWSTFIEAEMYPTRSLVPRSMDDSYKGKQSWAFNASTGEYYGLSGYGWVQASQEAVEYYADPRNGLTEDRVFEFELLTYNSTYQTETGVEAIINGTFMSHTQMPDDVVSYGRAFCLAGAQTNVSPYMLAARVRQEQGTAGSSPLISGTYPGYEGLYNFFNIKAAGNTETEIYVNGLTYARENGWTTRYNSIAGGASVLGTNYISKGQDTLYLQKFDVDSSYYGTFSHQYMQNILGAYNEGNTAYNAYKSIGILDNSFVFKIPIYNNMPATAVAKPDGNVNQAAVEAFVERLYVNILGRSSDASGKAHWCNCLIQGGESAAAVSARFIFSEEFTKKNLSDDEYVNRLYLTMMNRSYDASGKAHWLEVLQDGCSRRYVLSRFIASTEFTNICNVYGVEKGSITLTENRDLYPGATKFVARLYRETLKRNPDTSGLNHWAGLIGTKATTPYDVAERIVNSTEFKNKKYTNEEYVTILYAAFLGRQPDASGYKHWVNKLKSGASRESILHGFAYSTEFKGIAAKYGI